MGWGGGVGNLGGKLHCIVPTRAISGTEERSPSPGPSLLGKAGNLGGGLSCDKWDKDFLSPKNNGKPVKNFSIGLKTDPTTKLRN